MLRLLIAVALVHGFIDFVAPVWVVVRTGGAEAPVGHGIYIAAVVVLCLTPLQLVFLWFVLSLRLRELNANRRISVRVRDVLSHESIDTAFQPIFDLVTREVVGAEALARFTVEPAATPDVWFAEAMKVGAGRELELLAVRTALANTAELPEHLYVAINVSPSTLACPALLETLLASGLPACRLIVEVTEHTSIPDYVPLQEARARLRDHGIRVAVDDAGAGYASFRHIVALAPDIIKLDRGLVSGIDHDEACRALVAAVVMFAMESGASLVAEGIETAGELAAIEELGVDAAQGYYLGRPTTSHPDWQTWGSSSSSLPAGATRQLRPSA
jgi:EAL domain-containing protein (putative c-di-GMP-specific phosphodiesterase class I)